MKRLVLSATLIPLLFFAFHVSAKTEQFRFPKVHEDFCGAKIDYRICKCARHGEMCKDIQKERKTAQEELQNAFVRFVEGQMEMFARSCMGSGGIYSVINTECEYCEGTRVRDGGVCRDPKDVRPIEEIYSLPKVETAGGTQNLGYVVLGEGEFFLYSPGRGKWIGPIEGGGLQLYEGDVLHTTVNGRAKLRIGTTNTILLERSTLWMPSPKRERTFLERGALFIWEAVKRIGTNTPFDEIEEGGAHSITGRKGTAYLIEVEERSARYTVESGAIELWFRDDSERIKHEISAGTSVKATGVSITESPYSWKELLGQYAVKEEDFAEPPQFTAFAPIDPDAVNPPSAAYTGDLVGDVDIPSTSSSWKQWVGILVLLGLAGRFIYKNPELVKRTLSSFRKT